MLSRLLPGSIGRLTKTNHVSASKPSPGQGATSAAGRLCRTAREALGIAAAIINITIITIDMCLIVIIRIISIIISTIIIIITIIIITIITIMIIIMMNMTTIIITMYDYA